MIKLLKTLEGVILHPVTDDVVNRLKGTWCSCLLYDTCVCVCVCFTMYV